jgi:predicted dehydrogenase
MKRPARVGVVGCGVISRQYADNARAFPEFDIVACADLDPARSEVLARSHRYEAVSVEELVADPTIDVVLNLTPPGAHVDVIQAALQGGKHVYTEKPVATHAPDAASLIAEANRLGLRIGCAPDIFLGGAYQAARALIDEGAIGEPLSAGAAMLVGGQTTWHPDPDIFFADGAGPLLDMGPYYLTALVALLGPIHSATGFASTRVEERTIEIGPRTGETFRSSTPTHTIAALELEGQITASLTASFEAPTQYVCDLRIYGSDGVLELPVPNYFGGDLRLRRGRAGWEDVVYASRGPCEGRGLGLAEMVDAIKEGRPHRASGELGEHVVAVARAILQAAETGSAVTIADLPRQPAAMPVPVDAEAASG